MLWSSSLVGCGCLDGRGGIQGNDLGHADRAAAVAACGDGDLRTVAYAQLAHDLPDMDLHGGFGHSELAADNLVGIALAKARENGVLPLGKLRSMPNAVGAVGPLDAGSLDIEKGALLLIHDIPTVKELIDRIMADAERLIRGRLAGFLDADGKEALKVA